MLSTKYTMRILVAGILFIQNNVYIQKLFFIISVYKRVFMHDILQYEEKLIKTRLELNDLIEKYSNNKKENIDKAIIENKLNT